MVLSNKQIMNLCDAIDYCERNADIKFPAKTAFILARNKNILQPVYEAAYEGRKQIILENGTITNEETQEYSIPKEKIDIVNEKLIDLLDMVEDVNVKTIPLDSIEDVKLPVDVVKCLSPILEE